MRKTSQDGGDSTSITSGIENEIKKPGAIIKSKRNSIKRKVQNLSLDSDDTVIEPLLQKDKEKTDTTKQSAKFNLLSKTKTEAVGEEETDRDKLISDDKLEKTALSNASDVADRILPTSTAKENLMSKLTSENAPLHNHMNTNVFSNHDGLKTFVAPKSQILVEIDGSKHVGYNPSPLIFTTAKIHTDNKTKHMEPVQMTPVPILSTIEVSVMKSGINAGETSGHVTSNISAVYIPQSNKNATEQDPKPTNKTVSNPMIPQNKVADTKNQVLTDKTEGISNTKDKSSFTSSFNKETKLTQPNATTSLKENIIENKSIKNKVEKEDYHVKSISKPNPSTYKKDRNIVSHEVKSRGGSIASTKVTNNSITETNKPDSRCRENKINLNETVCQDSLDLQRSKPSDNVHSLDKVNKDISKDPANTSVSSRQLQRQSTILDKDEPISQLKPNIVSPLINNDSRGFHKSDESQKSSKFENTLSDKIKLPKSSANNIPTTSVTSVSTNNSVTNNITCAPTTAATLNKKSPPENSVINKTSASVISSSVRNHSPIAITTSASANKSPLPIISSANQAFDPTTITSTNNNVSAANKATISTTTAAVINNTSAPTTTNTSKVSDLSTITTITASNKISSSTTSTTVSTKLPSTSTAGNKISNPMTTTVDSKKMSFPSTTTVGNKISAASTTDTTSAKLSNPINKTGTNKTSVVTSTANAATNKLSSTLPTTMTENTISALSSTTTANSKLANSTIASTISGTGSKLSAVSSITTTGKASSPTTSIAAGNKTPTTSTMTVTVNKTSSPSSTTTADSKVSVLSSSTIENNKISGPVITTTTAVDKAITSNPNSSAKPIKSSSSPLPQLSNIPITKSATVIAPSVSKPSNIDKKSSNVSTFGNNKSGTPNETSTTKSHVPSTINIKPSSFTSTTKPVKVTTVHTPTTTSQQTVVGKLPTATTAKSVPTKPIPQPAKGKLAENTTKSSISNEKPITARSNSKSISSTTTSGMSSITSPASAVSSGSSSAPAQANKQSESKSKVMSNGSKNFKA